MTEPRVSVVVPCRNEAGTLHACLDAIAAQEAQAFEVLLVDGGSTDGGPETALARGIRVLADPGRGPAAARNVGISAARGRIVAFTDADCVPRFDWLARLCAPFDDPSVAGVAGAMRLPRDTLRGRLEDNDARLRYRGYITSNVAYRRDVLLQTGGFDEELVCAEDYDLAWRVMDAGHHIVRAPDAIVLHNPPELHGPVADYLAKQMWYARRDAPTLARALTRVSRAREPMLGSGQAIAHAAGALAPSLVLAGGALGVASRSRALTALALGAGALATARRVARDLAALGEARDAPAILALSLAKHAARGAGTIAGALGLARPSRWTFLKPRVGVGLAPSVASPSRPRSAA